MISPANEVMINNNNNNKEKRRRTRRTRRTKARRTRARRIRTRKNNRVSPFPLYFHVMFTEVSIAEEAPEGHLCNYSTGRASLELHQRQVPLLKYSIGTIVNTRWSPPL